VHGLSGAMVSHVTYAGACPKSARFEWSTVKGRAASLAKFEHVIGDPMYEMLVFVRFETECESGGGDTGPDRNSLIG
jgi:hypothetical protein